MIKKIFIDTHCHVDKYKNPLEIAKRLEKNKIYTIAVTNLPSRFIEGRPFLKEFKYVKLALGFHPLLVEKYHDEIELFKKESVNAKFIGEIGLDFSDEGIKCKDEQIKILKVIFSACEDKIVSIHSRKADDEIINLIDEFSIKKPILHWYSGNQQNIVKAIELGCYFSVNYKMLINEKGRKLVNIISRNRILPESDSPYINVKNVPDSVANLKEVYNYFIRKWKMEEEKLNILFQNNYKALIGR